MIHLSNLTQANLSVPSIVTIGVFDGVHRGHRYLIGRLVSEAHRLNRQAVVLTLYPHPDRVLRGQRGPYYLTPPAEKARLLGALGIDVVVTHPFDETVRHMRAADFVDLLLRHLKMASLWVTADFAMGYRREGDFAFLTAQGQTKHFTVHELDPLLDAENTRISSSGIREALIAGELARANEWLGRPYRLSGQIVHGDHRGRTLGFPTANLAVGEEDIVPANGVYACYAFLNPVDGDTPHRMLAVTNVGRRPTFGEGDAVRVEAHLLDFEGDIYGRTLTLDFVARLRSERRFDGLAALQAQIRADVAAGRAVLGQPAPK